MAVDKKESRDSDEHAKVAKNSERFHAPAALVFLGKRNPTRHRLAICRVLFRAESSGSLVGRIKFCSSSGGPPGAPCCIESYLLAQRSAPRSFLPTAGTIVRHPRPCCAGYEAVGTRLPGRIREYWSLRVRSERPLTFPRI